MRLDAPTLLLVTVILTFTVGILFLLSWSQARRMHALAIWGLAHLVGGVGSALLALRGLISDPLSIGLANALIIGAYGMIWNGILAFEGRRLRPRPVILCVALWSGACLVPDFFASVPARIVLASGMAASFCFAMAALIWKKRTEPLVSRYPAVFLLLAYGGMYAVRVPMALLIPPQPVGVHPLQTSAFAILACLGMLFTLALAFVFMALTKERAERLQRLAADTDPLTGIASRRAFVAEAQSALSRSNRTATLLLFDLDHFKRINDTYGHAVGDAVLVGFCHTAGALVPPGTIFGRMGGEEFACLLTGTEDARARAEMVRRAVASLAVPTLPDLHVSVSVGLATTEACGHDLDGLMRAADAALYAAKRNGRNRVESGGPGGSVPAPDGGLLDPHHDGIGSPAGVHHRDASEAGAFGAPRGLAPGTAGDGQAVDHPGQGWNTAQSLEGEARTEFRVRRAAR
jgi:diguanylate cyclase (GGDEF)-like protein